MGSIELLYKLTDSLSIMVFLGFQASWATYFLADAVTDGACFFAEYLKVLLRNASWE